MTDPAGAPDLRRPAPAAGRPDAGPVAPVRAARPRHRLDTSHSQVVRATPPTETARHRRSGPPGVATPRGHASATAFPARPMTREPCRPSAEQDRTRRPGHLAPQQMAHPGGHAGTPRLTGREPIAVH